MAKSLRSKFKRKMRAEKRVRYGAKVNTDFVNSAIFFRGAILAYSVENSTILKASQ